jgi:hypothetical protein
MDTNKIRGMHRQGLSMREIAATIKVSAMTVQRRIRCVASDAY